MNYLINISLTCLVFITLMVNCPAQENADTLPYHEKVILHLNNDIYCAGEVLWYSAKCFETNRTQCKAISKVLYVEILDATSGIISQQKIKLKKGNGNGTFDLPKDMQTGHYYIIAYTNWMKNQGISSFFCKEIKVLNPEKPAHISKKHSDIQDTIIHFYPESKHLVYGIKTDVAVIANNNNNNGIKLKGSVYDQAGNHILAFRTNNTGIGAFSLRPKSGHTYHAIINNDTLETYPLPCPDTMGFIMHIKDKKADILNAAVYYNSSDSVIVPRAFDFIVKNDEQTVYKKSGVISNDSMVFNIKKDHLCTGLNTFIISKRNTTDQPIIERLYYIPPASELLITIDSLKQSYGTREKVTMIINTTDKKGNPIPAELNLSVSHRKINTGKEDVRKHLSESLNIDQFVINPDDAVFFEHDLLNTLLMTVQVKNKTKITHDQQNSNSDSIHYIIEKYGIILSGQLLERNSLEPLAYDTVLLIDNKNQAFLRTTTTDSLGKFYYVFRNHYSNKNLLIVPLRRQDETLIKLNNNFSDDYPSLSVQPFSLTKEEETIAKNKLLMYQIRNAYNDSSIKKTEDNLIFNTKFYGVPDQTIIFEEYIELPNIEEYIRELLEKVVVVKNNGKSTIRIIYKNNNRTIGESPFFLINGVPVWDAQKILQLDPRHVISIKILNDQYYIGDLVLDGIFDVTIKADYFNEISIPLSFVYHNLKCYSEAVSFLSPEHHFDTGRKNTKPDYRSLLYWAPYLKTNEKGKTKVSFYTGDRSLNYNIIIKGIAGEFKGTEQRTLNIK